MSHSRIAVVVLFFAALLVPSVPAQATYSVVCTGYTSCSSAGYSHGGYSTAKSKSYWNMYTGTNCTNYVAYRLVATNGLPNKRPRSGVGNARDWGRAMSDVTNSTPTVGSVAWWGKTGNHVAYVERVVSSSEVWVSESNWAGAFDWRKITKTGTGWPDGFIHFKDTAPQVVKNTVSPAITGPVKVGVAATASAGTWSPSGTTPAYQWSAGGTVIKGATSKTFTPAPAQVGQKLTVTVSASRASYSSGSSPSAAVVVQPGSITPSKAPVVTGTGRVDEPLGVTPGEWTPTPAVVTYQWFSNGQPVPGATAASFAPGPGLVGSDVTVVASATLAGYADAASAPSAPVRVKEGVIAPTAVPLVSGTPAVGGTLTAGTGTWTKTGLAYSYQWFAADKAITAATGRTYTAAPSDAGKAVRVEVSAMRAGYAAASSSSKPTTAVTLGTISAPAARITGSSRLGSWVGIDAGALTPSRATVSYQWLKNGAVVKGSTRRTYKITTADLGRTLSARVTLSAPGYKTRTVTTAKISQSKATSTMTVSSKPGTRAATFTVKLAAPGTSAPSGKVVVSRKGARSVTVTVTRGTGKVTLTSQPRGRQTYTFTYSGSSTVVSSKKVVTTTIR